MPERIDVACPQCTEVVAVRSKDVIAEKEVQCANGHTFRLEDSGELARLARENLVD